jgi:Cys-rich repeat protein
MGDATCRLPAGVEGGTLVCDMESRTWQVQCMSDAQCQAGFRCTGGICVNPTCN